MLGLGVPSSIVNQTDETTVIRKQGFESKVIAGAEAAHQHERPIKFPTPPIHSGCCPAVPRLDAGVLRFVYPQPI